MIALLKCVLWLFSQLGERGPARLAQALAGVWMVLSPGKRRVTRTNLQRCYPSRSPEGRERLVRESFRHYVCLVLETGRNWFWTLDRLQALCVEVVGEELALAALASGRGVVALAPHWGAWEYLGLYLQARFDVAILYKPPSHPGLERALLEKRRRGGARMLAANAAGVRELYAFIRKGGGAGVLPDQEPSRGSGRFAPFFGIPALTGVLAPRLVQRTGCEVLFTVAERISDGHYRVHFLRADADIRSDDLDTALAAVNRGVEQCIAIDPAQYLWSYKRFRSRPEGEPPFYS